MAALVAALEGDEEKIDLFRAALLVSRLDNEDVDVEQYQRDVARMAGEVRAKLPADATPAARLEALKKYLFEENGFHGSRGDYYNRSNSYLNEVLEDREGLPITLAVLYMELARQLDVEVRGVGFPSHFIVAPAAAQSGDESWIDVYEGGQSLQFAPIWRSVPKNSWDARWQTRTWQSPPNVRSLCGCCKTCSASPGTARWSTDASLS